jgi:hypothetical protein
VAPQNRKEGFRFCVFPGYNWCGPGCNGPGEPINRVDAACKAHDRCYRRGRHRRACDKEFIRRLQPLIELDTQEGHHARVIYHFMRVKMFLF